MDNGTRIAVARTKPKKRPANAFPKIKVRNETGATRSLLKVPVCLSRTTATASIEVVPNNITREVARALSARLKE
jgi:hypothetical protein